MIAKCLNKLNYSGKKQYQTNDNDNGNATNQWEQYCRSAQDKQHQSKKEQPIPVLRNCYHKICYLYSASSIMVMSIFAHMHIFKSE